MKAKPFVISKQLVMQAYRLVKANRGAAGVDHQSLDDFEEGLKSNLYRLWNRMSSGSYFPAPVKSGLDTEEIGRGAGPWGADGGGQSGTNGCQAADRTRHRAALSE